MEEAARKILERILAKGAAPTLSPLAVRLVEMAADDQASAADLAQVISGDPGLATRLLSLVNSAAFRRGDTAVKDLQRAVVILGLREVRLMALSVSLRDTLPLKKGDQDYYAYWRLSLHRAVLAQQTARLAGRPEPSEAFVGGLLLELGLPLLLCVLSPQEKEGFPGVAAPLEQQLRWEKTRLGVNHRQVGVAAMHHWGLPMEFMLAQRLAAHPDRAEPLVKVVDFARQAVEAFFLEAVPLTQAHRLAVSWFGLDAEQVSRLLAQTFDLTAQTSRALDLDLDGQADLLAVMEKANAALHRLSTQVAPHLSRVAAETSPEDQPEAELDLAVINTLDAVAHEIRNPLMSVGGFARRLMEQAGQAEQGERVKKYAQVIMSEASRLDQVLAEMRAVVDPYQPQLASTELAEVLAGALERLRREPPPTLTGHPFTVRVQVPAGRFTAQADARGVEQVLAAMAAFAVHLATQAGVPADLEFCLRAGDGLVVWWLEGPGQAKASLGAMSEKSFGAELGLAKARRMLVAMSGGLVLKPTGENRVRLEARLPLVTKAAA